MDKKKLILYITIFFIITALSMLFSLGIDHFFKSLMHTETVSTAVADSLRDETLPDVSSESEKLESPAERMSRTDVRADSTIDSSGSTDIRISDESIAEFYENRNRGTDLDDRYDELSIQAKFGEGCEALEKDRISIVRQLKGYLENEVENGKDAKDLSFYKSGTEYFVRVALPEGIKDYHIIEYENAYDFENVFVTG